MYDLTVIIPTFNEEANIRNIVMAVDAVFHERGIRGQILVVDDKSTDATTGIISELKRTQDNVALLIREEDHGLSQSVADGFVHAESEICVVIDADFSHPPVLIPRMYDEIRKGSDIVIGSRYMEGGGIKKWPLKRRIISFGATFLGRLLFPEITDPVSGFFAIHKRVLAHATLKPRGYKILLEVLGKGSWENDLEIPFEFVDREAGTSKLKIRTIIDYARQVIDITLYSFRHHESAAWREWKKAIKFGLVGLSGVVVNEVVLIALREFLGVSNFLAPVLSIEISILNNFLWNDIWTFRAHRNSDGFRSWWYRLGSFQAIAAIGSILNYAIYLALTEIWTVYYPVAMLIGILAGFAWNFIVNRRLTWLKRRG